MSQVILSNSNHLATMQLWLLASQRVQRIQDCRTHWWWFQVLLSGSLCWCFRAPFFYRISSSSFWLKTHMRSPPSAGNSSGKILWSSASTNGGQVGFGFLSLQNNSTQTRQRKFSIDKNWYLVESESLERRGRGLSAHATIALVNIRQRQFHFTVGLFKVLSNPERINTHVCIIISICLARFSMWSVLSSPQCHVLWVSSTLKEDSSLFCIF